MKQVFRSNLAMIVGWLWMVFAAYNAVDLVVRYNGRPSMVAAAVLGVLTALVFVTCLRPVIVMSEEGVLVRNPLRNAFVPWSGVDEVTVSHSITITSGGRSVRCWAPQTSARERAAAARKGRPAPARGRFRTEPVRSKAEQAADEAMAGKTHADWVAEQITERAEAAQRTASVAGTAAVPETENGTGTAAVTENGTGNGAAAVTGSETGTENGSETGTGNDGLKVTWAPSALVALVLALALVVAAFVA
ncbi:hypothetical protein OIE13_25485 [Streptosporangium sp. NBC_01810]|uniref:hypothetical protein n=1 Tax=Streptosporangium sp. NBC_01810 TaxID=2975951 RepID=UPI002DD8F5A3|nr:hypothetical protein [Streptosporangium sp. NBC_01810]WSA24278.1 hypothetical protein OIE13_25485 [Streptosporangium sp. NBC_01810]